MNDLLAYIYCKDGYILLQCAMSKGRRVILNTCASSEMFSLAELVNVPRINKNVWLKTSAECINIFEVKNEHKTLAKE